MENNPPENEVSKLRRFANRVKIEIELKRIGIFCEANVLYEGSGAFSEEMWYKVTELCGQIQKATLDRQRIESLVEELNKPNSQRFETIKERIMRIGVQYIEAAPPNTDDSESDDENPQPEPKRIKTEERSQPSADGDETSNKS